MRKYSGDGSGVTLQPSLESQTRPASYVVLPHQALGAPGTDSVSFSDTFGQMFGSEEAYAGLATG